MHTSVQLHQTALHISDKCPLRKALIDITIDHCIQITHLSVLGHKSSIRSQQAFHRNDDSATQLVMGKVNAVRAWAAKSQTFPSLFPH